jgi:hypothetical protein
MNWKEERYALAWNRVFAGPEGKLLAESLRLVIAEIGPLEVGALQAHAGRRSFATELLRLAEKPNEPATAIRAPSRRVIVEE